MNPEFSINEEVKNSTKVSNMIEAPQQQVIAFDREQAISNYRKLFTRGSSLTKEILERVQHAEVANSKKYIFGYEFKTRHIWMLTSLLLLFFISFCGTITFWCTNLFDEHVKSHLVMSNESESFLSWQNPSTRPYMKVHIFNYTNIEDFKEKRADKLIVKDIGPYTFEEHVQRVNVVFNNDNTLTYQEKKSYKFIPEMSEGRQSDRLNVPNMPMISAIAQVKDSFYITKVAVGSLLSSLRSKPFLTLPAQRFIWGYDDEFFTLVKTVMSFQKPMPYDKFGLLAHKNGTNSNRITIKTGRNNINEIGTVVKYNDETSMSHWSTEECNRMDGTDGSFFGPDIIRSKKPVYLYQRDLCRKLPFHFQKEYQFLGIAATYRYTPPVNVFADPYIEPSNQCFCHMDTGVCPPHGVFNATPCALGPAYISFPHFLHGDPKLRERIEGLEPDVNVHSTYLDIHPTLGYTMAGITRLQINVMVKRSFGIDQVDMFEDGLILPVAWFDVGLQPNELPQSVIDIIYRTSYTVPRIETSLRYGSLLLLIITTTGIVLLLRGRLSTKKSGRRLERNISGLDALIQ